MKLLRGIRQVGASNWRVGVIIISVLLVIWNGTLLAWLRPGPFATASARTLSFAQRVAYQRAIEQVYWRHRLWPKENAKPKPSLDEVMSAGQIEKKVEDSLRDWQTLEDSWHKPIGSVQLQAEMERMAQHTRQPEVLRELFHALADDPLIIAECLARPVPVERLMSNLDGREGRPARPAARPGLWEQAVVAPHRGLRTMSIVTTSDRASTYTLPEISDIVACTDDSWTATSTTNAPEARRGHTAVWTGSEMIVWGGSGTRFLNTGGKYTPSIDSWTATSTTNAPTARLDPTAIWTGSEMIIWGGYTSGLGDVTTGGRYTPSSDSWVATSTINAPAVRGYHTAVWTGSE